jgi:molecular chaperone DnaK (HSP70)
MAAASRYVIGIDLGTTNCALAWADLAAIEAGEDARVQRFAVPQLVGEAEVAAAPTLPSFLYLPGHEERERSRLALPWSPRPDRIAGVWARDHGALLPGRLVSSAKSWLCHGDVDRRAAILPWEAEPADRVCSPVQASAEYLGHLRAAWNHEMAAGRPELRLEHQDIVLTLPASFDEEARELTLEAAQAAGLAHLTLQEEPTAALYAWLAAHRDHWGEHLRPGDAVLVCDVGGGTTDFTLVAVREKDGGLAFERVAVGDHLLLGGDNVDLALARLLESRLAGPPLTLRQRNALRHQVTSAKERLLGDEAPEQVSITVLGAGRALVGGAQTAALEREEVRTLLRDGFLPLVSIDERPKREGKRGLRELGLPYESDPAITRHLARFLVEAGEGQPVRPDAVLLTGGFFTSALARKRAIDAIGRWFRDADAAWQPRVLVSDAPATAVAEGAAHYGLARRNLGVRIGGGSPRAYYLGLQSAAAAGEDIMRGICIVPRGTEEGTRQGLDERVFEVVANRPRAFSLWSARTGHHAFGELVSLDPELMHRHAPLVAELRFGKRTRAATLAVRLEVAYTELGTLELWLASRDTDHRWRLQFELRGAGREAPEEAAGSEAEAAAAVVSDAALAGAVEIIAGAFAPDRAASATAPLDQLTSRLESVIGLGRHAWPLAAIRPLADALLAQADGRRRSARHEARWVNLLGFCMRPGFGATTDDFRMTQIRRAYLGGIAFPADVQCQAEWLVLWQRLAAGLTPGQQQDLHQRYGPPLVASIEKRGKRLAPQIERETWRLLASLERLPGQARATLGEMVMTRLERQQDDASLWWSLGRIGTRAPVYGPLNHVVPGSRVAKWIERIAAFKRLPPEALAAIADLAALTGDGARDVSDETRGRVQRLLEERGAPEALVARLLEPQAASRADLQRRYGESLPEGLALAADSAGG